MSDDILSGNVNDQPFPDFVPTKNRLVIKVIEQSSTYAQKTAGGIIISQSNDQSAYLKCEILALGPDCSDYLEHVKYVHILMGGGMRGAKPISMANGHFCCDEDDVWFYEEDMEEDEELDNDSTTSNLIKLVTD